MSVPKDRTNDLIEQFDAAHLPPGPDGIPRAGSSDFPASIDKWPAHQDIEDEKVFTKYMHDLYCAMIAMQRFLKQSVLGAGAFHQHFRFQTTYTGAPDITIEDIPVGEVFLNDSVQVFQRGRLLELGSEWTIRNDQRSIRLGGAHPDTGANGDSIIIYYARPLTV